MSRRVACALVALALLLPSTASAYVAGEQRPTWGNTSVWTTSIADCTFAAAANWEVAVLHHEPVEAEVISEFYAAGGNAEEGIDVEVWERYWRKHGIGGVRARLRELPGESILAINGPRLAASEDERLRRQLNRYHALILELSEHVVALVGYTSTGPLIVSYGEVEQMTWLEWRSESWGVYAPEPVTT